MGERGNEFVKTLKSLKIAEKFAKTLFTQRVLSCYNAKVVNHQTRMEIPRDGALRCEAGSERKRIHAEEFNQKEKKT